MRIHLLIALSGLLLAGSCGSPGKDAADFNDDLVELANKCIDRQEALTQTVKGGDCVKTNAALKALAKSTQHALDSLKQITPGKATEDKNFYEAARKYFTNLNELAANEYAEYCRLFCKADSLFTENDELRHAELAKAINRKDSAADAAFEMAQKRFATKHQINIR
ncbi:MAG: hypothetical protein FD123_39 [Bacteroidetes bacterium]|nr:MAG: hypothetical protein FD123_39 [Bacteroidota bacterium]